MSFSLVPSQRRHIPLWFAVICFTTTSVTVSVKPATAGPMLFVPPPGYSVRISSLTGETFPGTGLITANLPVNVAYDAMGVDPDGDVFRQVAATAETFSTPLAVVQGSTTLAELQAEAIVAYAVGVCPLPGFPTMPVPVAISSSGSVSADWFDGVNGPVFAEVSMRYRGNILFATAASADKDDPSNSDSFSSSATRNITGAARVSIQARGIVGGSNLNDNFISGEFTAVIDPFFEIDPNATFLFNGTPTRFADAYTVVVSDGVQNQSPTNGSAVPEPSTLALLACGLIGLLCAHGWRIRRLDST